MPKHDWSRPLPRSLDVASVLTVTTIGDVRTLIERHLPAAHRELPHWRGVAQALAAASRGGDTTAVEAALWLAAALEGLSCRPTNRPRLRKNRPRRPRGTD
jgi:hypothetical protein